MTNTITNRSTPASDPKSCAAEWAKKFGSVWMTSHDLLELLPCLAEAVV